MKTQTLILSELIEKLVELQKRMHGDPEVYADCGGNLRSIYHEVEGHISTKKEPYVSIAVIV